MEFLRQFGTAAFGDCEPPALVDDSIIAAAPAVS